MPESIDKRAAAMPPRARHVHFAGICGRVTGGLAMDLKAQGWTVTGTDSLAFPPMSGILTENGIQFEAGPGPFTVPAGVEIIVTGSTPPGPETGVPAARERGIPVLTLPAFLQQHIFARERRIVIAGTNGKTTTTSMLAWILECAGLAPDYLIGGQSRHFPGPVRMRGAKLMVLEGDEYPACLDDRIPKFHFLQPHILLLTNISYDHAEIFPDAAAVEAEFAKLIHNMPPDALLIAAASPLVERLTATAPCRVLLIGFSDQYPVRISLPRQTAQGMVFRINNQPIVLQLSGRMNASNAALALAAAEACGVPPATAAASLVTFEGVAGRCECLHENNNLTIYSDEGYHPEALRETIAALRLRHPGRRLITVLQARYTGGRGGFQHLTLPAALTDADAVILTPVFDYQTFPGGPLTTRTLAAACKRQGQRVHVLARSRHLPAFYRRHHKPGDVLLVSLAMRQEAVLEALLLTARELAPP